ncbi:hypothetical protein NQ176_g3585 [Zarea fungicola]|uniref:Uncharacterized protein n=1 Tax=Zarea fungicola TaxID=93591 RepID=A0ACC1NHW8_9HYPO|nr:hypothetical protein NQ176_g3585 [Lecanicillium fungicola]
MAMSAKPYALDLPVHPDGGPEHVRKALSGENTTPANYKFAAKTDAIDIVYHVCGKGPQLIVAVSPGWGGGINYLPNILKPILESGKITLVCVQPRGTLPSGRPDEANMSSKHMAADMDELRRQLSQETLTILGHSNGGTIALAYASAFPSRVSKCILINAQFIHYKNESAIIEGQLEWRKSDARFASSVAALKAWDARGIETDEDATQYLIDIINLYFVNPDVSAQIYADDKGPTMVQEWPMRKQYAIDKQPENDVLLGASKVTAETILFTGREDWICSVESSTYAKELIGANAKLVVYENCAHMPWLDNKDQFFQDLIEFIG